MAKPVHYERVWLNCFEPLSAETIHQLKMQMVRVAKRLSMLEDAC